MRGTRPSYSSSAVRNRQTEAGPSGRPTLISAALPPPIARNSGSEILGGPCLSSSSLSSPGTGSGFVTPPGGGSPRIVPSGIRTAIRPCVLDFTSARYAVMSSAVWSRSPT